MIQELINIDNIAQKTAAELAKFNIDYWDNLHQRAIWEKQNSGWQQQARIGDAIRKNEFPIKPLDAAPDYKGKFYKDNWIKKAFDWTVSMLCKSRVDIELTTIEGGISPMLEYLEYEMCHAADLMDFTSQDEPSLYDKYYKGEGWINGYWNTLKKSQFYRTGRPFFRYISCDKIAIDPATSMPDKSDMRYIFHEEYYDLPTIKMRYPNYADQIMESRNDLKPNTSNLVKLVTVQYKDTIRSQKIYVDYPNGYHSEYPIIELQLLVSAQANNAEAIKEYNRQIETSQTTLDFGNWLLNDWVFPEGTVLSDPDECEDNVVWQCIYYPDGKLVLSMNYIWSDFTYFNLPGNYMPGKSMCFGQAYYLADELESYTNFRTILMLLSMRYYIIKELIQQDSLVNEDDYLKNGQKIGKMPIVKADWQRTHRGQKAVEYMQMPEFPTALLRLGDMLENSIRTTSKVTEPLVGQQQNAGQAGITVAQLNAQAYTGFKSDVSAYEKFQVKKADWLKAMICRYRNYPHKIMGLDENNQEALIDIATNVLNKLVGTDAKTNVHVIDNYEELERMERETAMALRNLGTVSGKYVNEKSGIKSPIKEFEAARTETGEKQKIEFINSKPELNNLIETAMKFNQDLDQLMAKRKDQMSAQGGA